eukprot:608714-Pyramimonas_sp.AAC.1
MVVDVPEVDAYSVKLASHQLSLTLDSPASLVSDLKAELVRQLGLAGNKFRLLRGNTFLRESDSLSYYNLGGKGDITRNSLQ